MNKLILLVFIFLQGCAHYLYQGKITDTEFSGQQGDFQVYWTKTDPLIGAAGDVDTVILDSCGTAKTFTNSDKGYVFEAPATNFTKVGESSLNTLLCGKVVHSGSLKNFKDDMLNVLIECIPKTGDFSLPPRFLKAKSIPYKFPIKVKKSWSFMSNAPAPPKLVCKNE